MFDYDVLQTVFKSMFKKINFFCFFIKKSMLKKKKKSKFLKKKQRNHAAKISMNHGPKQGAPTW